MSASFRKVYRHADLDRMFAPKSVAVVGVSPTAGGFGSRTLAILKQGKFGGRIYPVNTKYERIGEEQCYPSIRELPETPDCVIIAVPRDGVEPIVVDCAERGVGGVVIYSSGYSETGRADRAKQQARLVQISRESGLRILGPNCIGLLNYTNRFLGTFFIPVPDAPLRAPRPDAVGIVSQSGALGFALSQAIERGMSFSHVLACGNACDVDVADQISYLADDPNCRAIACVFEGMSNPRRIIDAAEVAHAANKPLVIYKMAVGVQGAAAAISHTGSLAGSSAAYRAAFKRAGIVVVDNLEALLETASFFAKAPLQPKSLGVAVVATSGGSCIMSADMAERHNVPLPQPTAEAREVLERVVPEFGSPRNPCDVTAQVVGDPESLRACVDAIMGDDTFGALVVPQVHASTVTAARIKVFSEAAGRYGKIACAVWLNEWLEGPGSLETEIDPNVVMFRSMDRCFATLAAWNEREQWLRAQPRKLTRTSPADAALTVAKLLDGAGNRILTEREAKKILGAYGVPVVQEDLVQSGDDAVAVASRMGFPVAMKIESPDLPHKTEAGVIRLNLGTAAEVQTALDEVMANAKRVSPSPRVNGVLIQPMIPAGTEIMIGARVDPLFGPLVVVGLGGILVELLKDTALDLAPITHDEALAMIGGLKGKAALTGFRGSLPVNLDKLANIVCRLSELIADQQELISELDVNPLICSGDRIIAVDALIVAQRS